MFAVRFTLAEQARARIALVDAGLAMKTLKAFWATLLTFFRALLGAMAAFQRLGCMSLVASLSFCTQADLWDGRWPAGWS